MRGNKARTRPRGGLSKARAQKVHAARRAHERYGLGPSDMEAIAKMIRSGRSRPRGTQSNRVSHHEVDYEGVPVAVVYDRKRKQVITVLPRDADSC